MSGAAPDQPAPRYPAFISYSRADRQIAQTLQRNLERYVLPQASEILGPNASDRPFRRVFRDEDELVPGQDLPGRIREGLEHSEFLVVLCSPAAAKSSWVDKELVEFVGLHGVKRIIAVVVSGEPNAGRTGVGAAHEALPPPLRFTVNDGVVTDVPCDEPLWLDWRGQQRGDRLNFLRLVAALLSLSSLDDLVRRDQARERAARRLQRRIIVGVSALACVAVLTAFTSYRQRQNALEIQSTYLGAESFKQSQAFDNASAAVLALAALPAGRGIVLPRRSTAIAERALVSALNLNRLRAVFRHGGPIQTVRFNRSGTRFVTASEDGTAMIVDIETRRVIARLTHERTVDHAVFSDDDTRVATASSDYTAAVWDAESGRKIATLTGHTFAVDYIEFSPDGRKILTSSVDGTNRIWDATTGAQLGMIGTLNGSYNRARYSPDGRMIAGSADGRVHLWSADSVKSIVTINAKAQDVRSIRFDGTGKRVVTAEVMGVRIWNAASGALIRTIPESEATLDALFDPGGTRLVIVPTRADPQVLDAATGKVVATLIGHLYNITNAWFSRDGSRVLTTSPDGTARMWEAETGLELLQFGHFNGVPLSSAQMSPDARLVLTGTPDGLVQLWDAEIPKPAMILSGHTERIVSVQYSADGTKLVTGSRDHTAIVWDARKGSPLVVLRGHTAPVWAATFNRDVSLVATGSMDKTAIVWDAQSGARVATLTGHINSISEVEFSPDSRFVVTASRDWKARVWDAHSGALAKTIQHKQPVNMAHFSPDGQTVLTVSNDATAMLWNRTTDDLKVLRHPAKVLDGAFDSQGRRVVTACDDGAVRIWDVRTGALLRTMGGHADTVNAVQFDPTGLRVLSVSDDALGLLRDAETGAELARLPHSSAVKGASYSPDGKYIASVDAVGMLYLWTSDAAAVTRMTRTEHDGAPVVFSPDSRSVVMASTDPTIAIWSLAEPQFAGSHAHGRALVDAGCRALHAIDGYENAPAFVLSAALLNPNDPAPCDRPGALTLAFYRNAWCSTVTWGCAIPKPAAEPPAPPTRPAPKKEEKQRE